MRRLLFVLVALCQGHSLSAQSQSQSESQAQASRGSGTEPGTEPGSLTFPLYVGDDPQPIYMVYRESDLMSSTRMGAVCAEFVRSHSDVLGVSLNQPGAEEAMMMNICQTASQQFGVNLEFSLEDFQSRKNESKRIIKINEILYFAKNGWTPLKNVLPELRSDMVMRNINVTFKRRKFEYVSDALLMAKKKWNFDYELTKESCGIFNEDVLNDYNLQNDETAAYVYALGLQYIICTTNYYISNVDGSGYYVPFNQVMNIHRINDVIYDLATSKNMGQMAAELLQHDSVRLYQTALFSKDNYGLNLQTEWHRDLNMSPINAGAGGSVTFWCPLSRDLDRLQGDSMLRFLEGSHRDISQKIWYKGLDSADTRYEGYAQPRVLKVGDCTAHHGWVLHYAAPQNKNSEHKQRLAIGFTYVAGDSTVLTDLYGQSDPHRRAHFGDEDEYSYRDWIKDLNEGDVIDHPLLPLVYDANA